MGEEDLSSFRVEEGKGTELESTDKNPETQVSFEAVRELIKESHRELDAFMRARVEALLQARGVLANEASDTSTTIDDSEIARIAQKVEQLSHPQTDPVTANDLIETTLSLYPDILELSGQLYTFNTQSEQSQEDLGDAERSRDEFDAEAEKTRKGSIISRALNWKKSRTVKVDRAKFDEPIDRLRAQAGEIREKQGVIQEVLAELKYQVDTRLQRAAVISVDEIVEKSKTLTDQIESGPVTKQLTDEMIEEVLSPKIDQEAELRYGIPADVKAEYLDLIRYFSEFGVTYNSNGMTNEDQVKADRLEHIQNSFHIYNSASAINFHVNLENEPSNARYLRLMRIFEAQLISNELQSFSSLCQGLDPASASKVSAHTSEVINPRAASKYSRERCFELESSSIVDITADLTFVRWPFIKRFFEQSGLLLEEDSSKIEEVVIRRNCLEVIGPGGHESSRGSPAAYGIERLNNPIAIPYFLDHIKKHGSGGTDAIIYQAILNLLSGDEEEVAAVLQTMPEEDREFIALMRDPDSYLNRFNIIGDEYYGSRMAGHRDRTLQMEKVVSALVNAGKLEITDDKIREYDGPLGFYTLNGMEMRNLSLLREAAPLLGVSIKDLVESLFGDLTASLDFTGSEDLDFLQELAADLEITPRVAFDRLGEDLRERLKTGLRSYGVADRIRNIARVADLLDEDRKTFYEAFIPFSEISPYEDGFLSVLDILSEGMRVTAFDIFDRILNDGLAKRGQHLSIRYSIDSKPEVMQFVLDYIDWLNSKDDPRSSQHAAYVSECMSSAFEHAANFNNANTETTREPLDDLQDRFREQTEKLLDSEDPVIRYYAYESLIRTGGLKLSRFSGLVGFNTPENIGQIRASNLELGVEDRIYDGTIKNLIESAIIALDPSVKALLADPRKLGRIRQQLIQKFMEYAAEEGKNDDDESYHRVLNKLREIARIYTSTDYSIIEKRSIFLDGFGLSDVDDPKVKEQISALPEEDQRQAFQDLIRNEFEGILISSGSSEYYNYLSVRLADPSIAEEERISIISKQERMRSAVQAADVRNRRLYQTAQGLSDEEFLEAVIPYETSVSQVGNGNVTYSILESGTLCDGLLGGDAEIQEHNLEAHVSQTRFYQAKQPFGILQDRLPSFGNPHGITVNRVYGDVTGLPHPPHGGVNGTEYMMGPAHRLIFLGLPSTEITAIVLTPGQNSRGEYETQKKAIATKGFFVPIYWDTNVELWTPEEFDDMKVFYHYSNARGYDQEVIDDAYSYYLECFGNPDTKASVVFLKAVDVVKNSETPLEEVDLVVLAGFLRHNDLNSHPLEWYRTSDFNLIFPDIKKAAASRSRDRARGMIFDYPEGATPREHGGLTGISDITLRAESSLDRLLNDETAQAFGDDAPTHKSELERSLSRVIFRTSIKGEGSERKVDIDRVREVSENISALHRRLFANAWTGVWEDLTAGGTFDAELMSSIRSRVALTVTGSIAREEAMPGSDLDYNIVVDDISGDVEREPLLQFVRGSLLPAFNRILSGSGLHIDAGMMKEDESPISTLSSIRDFEINLAKRKQDEEPTAILSYSPIFADDQPIVDQARRMLLVDNRTTVLLEAFIERDLEYGIGEKESYTAIFERMIKQLTESGDIRSVKTSLQRALMFKLQLLMARAVGEGKITPDEVSKIPSGTLDLIGFLSEQEVLSRNEAEVCSELWAMAYKLRLLRDIYSENPAQADKQQAAFRVDDISFEEREKLYQLIDQFRSQVLYK